MEIVRVTGIPDNVDLNNFASQVNDLFGSNPDIGTFRVRKKNNKGIELVFQNGFDAMEGQRLLHKHTYICPITDIMYILNAKIVIDKDNSVSVHRNLISAEDDLPPKASLKGGEKLLRKIAKLQKKIIEKTKSSKHLSTSRSSDRKPNDKNKKKYKELRETDLRGSSQCIDQCSGSSDESPYCHSRSRSRSLSLKKSVDKELCKKEPRNKSLSYKTSLPSERLFDGDHSPCRKRSEEKESSRRLRKSPMRDNEVSGRNDDRPSHERRLNHEPPFKSRSDDRSSRERRSNNHESTFKRRNDVRSSHERQLSHESPFKRRNDDRSSHERRLNHESPFKRRNDDRSPYERRPNHETPFKSRSDDRSSHERRLNHESPVKRRIDDRSSHERRLNHESPFKSRSDDRLSRERRSNNHESPFKRRSDAGSSHERRLNDHESSFKRRPFNRKYKESLYSAIRPKYEYKTEFSSKSSYFKGIHEMKKEYNSMERELDSDSNKYFYQNKSDKTNRKINRQTYLHDHEKKIQKVVDEIVKYVDLEDVPNFVSLENSDKEIIFEVLRSYIVSRLKEMRFSSNLDIKTIVEDYKLKHDALKDKDLFDQFSKELISMGTEKKQSLSSEELSRMIDDVLGKTQIDQLMEEDTKPDIKCIKLEHIKTEYTDDIEEKEKIETIHLENPQDIERMKTVANGIKKIKPKKFFIPIRHLLKNMRVVIYNNTNAVDFETLVPKLMYVLEKIIENLLVDKERIRAAKVKKLFRRTHPIRNDGEFVSYIIQWYLDGVFENEELLEKNIRETFLTKTQADIEEGEIIGLDDDNTEEKVTIKTEPIDEYNDVTEGNDNITPELNDIKQEINIKVEDDIPDITKEIDTLDEVMTNHLKQENVSPKNEDLPDISDELNKIDDVINSCQNELENINNKIKEEPMDEENIILNLPENTQNPDKQVLFLENDNSVNCQIKQLSVNRPNEDEISENITPKESRNDINLNIPQTVSPNGINMNNSQSNECPNAIQIISPINLSSNVSQNVSPSDINLNISQNNVLNVSQIISPNNVSIDVSNNSPEGIIPNITQNISLNDFSQINVTPNVSQIDTQNYANLIESQNIPSNGSNVSQNVESIDAIRSFIMNQMTENQGIEDLVSSLLD